MTSPDGQSTNTESTWSQERHLLQEICDNTPAVVYVKDRDGRYELINRRWAELFDVTPEEVRGQDDFAIFPEEMAIAFRENDAIVFETGRALTVEEVAPHRDGPHTYLSVKFPVFDNDGSVRAVAGISTDNTERVAARRDLADVTRRLGSILNASTDGIYGLDEEGRVTFVNLATERILGWTSAELLGRKHDEAMHHRDVHGDPFAREACPIHRAIETGQPSHVENAEFWGRHGDHIPVGYTVSPLVDAGRVEGAVVTFWDNSEAKLRKQHEEELRTARFVQQQLYPKRPPDVPGFDIAGAVYPTTQACGDYFDFVPFGSGWALAIGDVTGHGLGAALQMVEARAILRTTLAMERDLVAVVRHLNVHLVEDTPDDSFLSLLVGHLDPTERTFEYVGAGHDGWMVRATGEVERLKSTGLLLGLFEGAPLELSPPVRFGTGDTLVLMTDGVAEAHTPTYDLFGWDRAIECIRDHRDEPADVIVNRVYGAARAFSGQPELDDDVTLIVAKCVG